MPILEEQYPQVADKIRAARRVGWTDSDIETSLGQVFGGGAPAAAPDSGSIESQLAALPSTTGDKIKGAGRFVAETATSIVPAFVGGALGSGIPIVGSLGGAAVGAGVGEALRQMFFDDEVKPSTIAYAAATGWIPGLKFPKVVGTGARLALKAAEGGAFGGVLGEGRKAIEQGKDYQFKLADTAMNTMMGAAFGAGFEKLFPSLPQNVQDKIAAVHADLSDPDVRLGLVKSALGKKYSDVTPQEAEALARTGIPRPGEEWRRPGGKPSGATEPGQAPVVPGAPPPVMQSTALAQLAAGTYSPAEIAKIVGVDDAGVKALIAAGQFKEVGKGRYTLEAKAPVPPAAAKGTPAAAGTPTQKGGGAKMTIDDRDFITRFAAANEAERMRMSKGLKVSSPQWRQIQEVLRAEDLARNAPTPQPGEAAAELARAPVAQGRTSRDAALIAKLEGDLARPEFADPDTQQAIRAQIVQIQSGQAGAPEAAPGPVPQQTQSAIDQGIDQAITQMAGQQPAAPVAAAPAVPAPEPAAAPPTARPVIGPLPPDLAKIKPRFNAGKHGEVDVTYTRDLEKAAATIANKKVLSKADARILGYVMNQTGLDEAGARAFGNDVKAYISQNRLNDKGVKGPGSKVTVPELWSPAAAPEPDIPLVKTAVPESDFIV